MVSIALKGTKVLHAKEKKKKQKKLCVCKLCSGKVRFHAVGAHMCAAKQAER